MRIIVAPDSFKGSLSSNQVGQIIRNAFLKEIPDVEIDVIPLADGGEGTVDSFLFATEGTRVDLTVTGPTGEKVNSYYGVSSVDEQIAVIEVANIAGYSMVSEVERNPFHLTTLGVGECLKHALEQGFRKIIIGLGGSATNDGGIGMLQALGVSFLDKNDSKLPPYPTSLAQVKKVDFSGLDPRVKEAKISIASDVNNPLCGTNGASTIFGPQKGATLTQIEELDKSLASYAKCIEQQLGRSFSDIPGAGAAGGLGFALLLLGATIESGAALVAKMANLYQRLCNIEWLITGEGKTDGQTLRGKLPYTLASQAKKTGAPTILISGALEGELEPLYDVFHSIHSIANGPMSLAECMENAEYLLYHKARNIARLIRKS